MSKTKILVDGGDPRAGQLRRLALDRRLAWRGAARFAQEVARSALGYGIVLRAAACAGEGWVYEDANGRPSVVSSAAARVSPCAASALASAGKSSLPSSRRLTLEKSKGQNGISGLGLIDP